MRPAPLPEVKPILIALTLSVLSACASEGSAAAQDSGASQAPPAQLDVDRANRSVDASRSTAIVEAANRVAPSVVSVNVTRRVTGYARSRFLVPRQYERLVEGFGSGFIITSDGLVVTNQHVVDGAEEIVVTTSGGEDYPARLLGEDPLTDIAVLRIEGDSFPAVQIGNSQDLMIGEWVVAFGNPYAYLLGNSEPTVTTGVVSAVGRNILPSDDQPGIYVDMIQTDAAINRGNSGGPLTNALGEVVGVNSSILSESGGSVGIGFAIPIERAIRVAEELSNYGRVRRAWVGLEIARSEDLRDWKNRGGIEVAAVAPGGPAAIARIAAGDVMVAANGRPLRTFLDWEAARLDVTVGDTMEIEVSRRGRTRTAVVTVADLPSTTATRVEILQDIEVIDVTPAIQVERGLNYESGVLIVSIGDRTAQATGLRPGDVILQINRSRVTSADDIRRIIEASTRRNRRSAFRFFFERDRRTLTTDFYVSR